MRFAQEEKAHYGDSTIMCLP